MKKLILFLCIGIISCTYQHPPKIVRIVPFEAIPPSHIKIIREALEKAYPIKVVLNDVIPLPQDCFVNEKTPRYRADKLIFFLKNEFKSDQYKAGYATVDISTTKKNAFGMTLKPESKYRDWGIFGLGYKPGKACIISTFRMKGNGELVLKERLAKVFVHEIGHNLGLPHCTDKQCVMTDAAESIKTIDLVKGNLCEKCKNKLDL
jgi:archaemetzincin